MEIVRNRIEIYKVLNNTIYGKPMGAVRKRLNLIFCSNRVKYEQVIKE